jgi:hypothetical protein
MVRFLIVIFIFNSFVAPVFAKSNCCPTMMEMTADSAQLMEESNSEVMTETNDDCLMCDETKGSSCEYSDCTYHFSPFSIPSELSIIQKMAVFRAFVLSSVPLSELVLPITTPPPLV